MLKEERFLKIQELINQHEIVKVSEITSVLNVTEMTVRRDLQSLEEQGLLIRVHGGAKKIDILSPQELSHLEKQEIHIDEKKEIAKRIASMIVNGDTIFLGSGTTLEFVYDYLDVTFVKIITNSINVFNRFVDDERFELLLVGGTYRIRTGAFVGRFANETLKKMRVKKAFIGANGVFENNITTSNEEEGVIQQVVLDNANEKYIVADHYKLNHEDFFCFYDLNDVTALITDSGISKEVQKKYETFTKII
ncbi:DeoR/GlpR family DNA-binding transcription regulator [Carnobacterium maltaromaticum]|uniref:DeoR/GlpR family DNA-binding transcription regulator n=1 Tax=Carnobacterium maltaromaticum TaxID=2751 RepID=UPI00191BB6C1|nr:DeoR/GlpR family DNA-binding transcription regulator [Carnobacterium maltaromaticum]CAD5901643.1 Lactose phosphotransferase system repressor [Carnobacterium maltaromaticum]